MPPAKKSTPSRARSQAFKEPAALKRLSESLDAAHEALSELRKEDVGHGARAVYKDLRTFVSNARRDTGKLARALARDFEQAEKRLAGFPTSTRSARRSTARRGASIRGASGSATRRRSKPERPAFSTVGVQSIVSS